MRATTASTPFRILEAEAGGEQKQVARVLDVMQIVGVVHNALDVAFMVAHLHLSFKI